MKMHRLKDGCFSASYNDDIYASVTLYFHNRCAKAHKLRIRPLSNAADTKTVTISGHAKGSTRYWNWASGFDIDDMGRA
ncbi:hypothetical protein AN218_14740 [Streptomyces nanshensis]|uniref:Uncharacterized protein n=2 Tax=Streptomyces nanshensis TaxID=518642 RepID=A0A1E7L4C8_9ACTN|nr:hypothetical protein AN218_14740 [Streptomyces nanshensis]